MRKTMFFPNALPNKTVLISVEPFHALEPEDRRLHFVTNEYDEMFILSGKITQGILTEREPFAPTSDKLISGHLHNIYRALNVEAGTELFVRVRELI